MKSKSDYGMTICSMCGKEARRNGAMQKYCPECSEEKSRERRRVWASKHPANKDVVIRTHAKTQQKEISNGKLFANKSLTLSESRGKDEEDFMHVIIVKVPFTYAFSKNAIFTTNCQTRGHLRLRQEANELQDNLASKIKHGLSHPIMGDTKFYEAKVYIDIFVEKPDHRGDAINVIDSVCDAVKSAIGVDDRWFCIRRVDWQIVRHGQPYLTVGIYQSATEDQRSCHRCGRIFPMSVFHGKQRKGRVCYECRNGKQYGNPPGVAVDVEAQP